MVAQMGKNLPAVRRLGFYPWLGKIPWRRKWLSTSAFLPGEVQGQRSLVSYSPWGGKELDTTEQHTHTHTCIIKGRNLSVSKEREKVTSNTGWSGHAGDGEQNLGNVGFRSEILCSVHSLFDLIHLQGETTKNRDTCFSELSIEICSVWM